MILGIRHTGYNRKIKFRVWRGVDSREAVWLQYTGLHDSKGNEIFEGDVLSFACDYARTKAPGKYDELDRVVRFIDGCFTVDGLPISGGYFVGIEVIGNIFERELL